jgi:hypothetical protein
MNFYVHGANKSIWANPFKLTKNHDNLEEVLQKYEQMIRTTPLLYDSLYRLSGKELGCWCHPSPCHGNVLIKLFAEKYL